MAKIIIENTRAHDITLSHKSGTVVVPAARENATKRDEIIHGTAEADEAVVADLRKSSPVVEHYFAEGWLRMPKRATKAETKEPEKDPKKDPATDGDKK